MKVVNLVFQVFFLLVILVFDQNRLKCQSSLLGMQSAIIEAYFFKNFSKERISLMSPYVFKNC